MEKRVLRTSDRYANFAYGKEYEAIPTAKTRIDGDWVITRYEIVDEDGDRYPIMGKGGDLKSGWEWVD